MNWEGNVNVGVSLGTGFWIFLTVLVIAGIVWHLVKENKLNTGDLAGMFERSITPSLTYSKN